jgi:hypothetical protein
MRGYPGIGAAVSQGVPLTHNEQAMTAVPAIPRSTHAYAASLAAIGVDMQVRVQDRLSSSETNLNSLLAAFAAAESADKWSSVGSLIRRSK